MNNSQQEPHLPTENQFTELHKEFNNQRLFKRLQEKHRAKAFWEEHRKMYLSVLGVSFVFNLLSALTASALVYTFALNLTNSISVSVIITAIVLTALELLKRETASNLFHNWFQFRTFSPAMIGAVILLSVISTTASYFGAEKTILSFTAPPQLKDYRSEVGSIEQNISSIDEQIKAQSAKKTRSSQRTIERLSETKGKLTDELLRTRQKTDAENERVQESHTNQTNLNASAFAYITLCCEICLLLALIYLQYYDYRSFSEYANSKGKAGNFKVHNYELNGSKSQSAAALNQSAREPIGYKYGNGNSSKVSEPEPIIQSVTQTVTQTVTNGRKCVHCGEEYEHGHARQKYCCSDCRIKAWQKKTGRELIVKH